MAMTLISRRLRALLPLVCLAAACGASDRILVLRAEGPDFKGTMEGLKGELGPGFEFEEKIVGPGFGTREAASLVAARRPKAIVLMDNQAIRIHAGAQKVWSDSVPYPPAIALMAVRVDKAIAGLRNTTGIIYEVPAVTIFVNLRSLSEEPVRKVGVITRPYMADFVRESAAWCERERIVLVPHEVPEDRKNVARAVREGIRRLRDRENVDALWILNDNHFLTAEIIREGWIPALERFRKPVLVGVENLVAAGTRFGTYAVLPDHYGLGAQAAGMIVRLKEDGWRMDGSSKVEHPLAVLKVLNLEQARNGMRIRRESLLEVDKVIK
jgi:hypothetical protein